MPRPKGSKNKPKTADKTTLVSTVDYTELIEEKLNEKTQISAEITSITDQLEALKAQSVAARTYSLGKIQKSVFLVGDGAQLCYNTYLDMGIPAVLAPGNLVSQSAWGVAMAAFGQTPAPAEELLPVYLRLSQAERERQARLAAQAAQE